MNAKASKVVLKLYITFSGLILLLIIVIAGFSVNAELTLTDNFKRAHQNLENTAQYNPLREGLSLEESRLKIVEESLERKRQYKLGNKPAFVRSNAIIDIACFDWDENILPVSNDNRYCKSISSYRPGTPLTSLFYWAIGLLAVAILLYAIRRWASWLTKDDITEKDQGNKIQ